MKEQRPHQGSLGPTRPPAACCPGLGGLTHRAEAEPRCTHCKLCLNLQPQSHSQTQGQRNAPEMGPAHGDKPTEKATTRGGLDCGSPPCPGASAAHANLALAPTPKGKQARSQGTTSQAPTGAHRSTQHTPTSTPSASSVLVLSSEVSSCHSLSSFPIVPSMGIKVPILSRSIFQSTGKHPL